MPSSRVRRRAGVDSGALLTDPPHSLVRQSWAPRRQQHGVVNADGFGIGWYVDGLTEPARHRGAGPIWADETFTDLAGSSGPARCWPRSDRPPSGWPAVRPRPRPSGPASGCSATTVRSTAGRPSPAGLGWDLDPGALALLEAPTDSALLWAIARDLFASGKSPEAALAEVVGRTVAAGGGRLTFLLTDGHRITATAWGTSLCWRRLPGGIVVASEPYDDDPSGWTSLTVRCWSPTVRRQCRTPARRPLRVEPLTVSNRPRVEPPHVDTPSGRTAAVNLLDQSTPYGDPHA